MIISNERKRIGFLIVPEFHLYHPLGGAEAILEQLVREFSHEYEVFVFHGIQTNEQCSYKRKQHNCQITSVGAFPITNTVRNHGVIQSELIFPKVYELLSSCHVLIQFERVLSLSATPIRYAVLGGTCYPHCKEVVESAAWERLILPSNFVYTDIISRWHIPRNQVSIIPNGLNLAEFNPGNFLTNTSESNKIIFIIPSRPDWGKGFELSFELARTCKRFNMDISVHCFQQKSLLELSTFYTDLCQCAKGLNLVLRPWVARNQMASVYREATMTLCLGDLPEGFGMTAIESIACGTPVLAKPLGFLKDMFPPKHGLFHFKENQSLNDIAKSLGNLVHVGRENCLLRGIPYIRENYSENVMTRKYRELIETDIARLPNHV
ncbi:lipopolysaccharide 1,2-N- acetylglucosaminetransferase [Beggiatoa sp. PS]|nr:lipopolysaccharide 1,2-N- acetylglucosaminetransferase [Beggiatoa sp. PS]